MMLMMPGLTLESYSKHFDYDTELLDQFVNHAERQQVDVVVPWLKLDYDDETDGDGNFDDQKQTGMSLKQIKHWDPSDE